MTKHNAMKRVMFFAVLMCCIMTASAQHPDKKPQTQRSWEESLRIVEKMNRHENVFNMELDSVTSEYTKVVLDYDAHSNCTWFAFYYLDDGWEMAYAYEYAYDEQDRLTAMIDYDIEEKEEYFYNAQGLVEEILYSYYDETWQVSGKTVLSYDEDNRVFLSMGYEMVDGDWVEASKQTWDYEDGLLQATATYIVNASGEWEGNGRTEYHYDGDGLCTEEIESEWAGYWNTLNKTVYHYEAQQCYEKIEYGWDGDGWNERYKNSYDYDTSGNLLCEIEFYYNPEIQDWTHISKYEYLFDASNNCTDYYEYYYLVALETWSLQETYHISYGTPGIESIAGLALYWDLFGWNIPIQNKVEQLIMDEDGEYYYLDFNYSSTDGIDEPMAGVFGVYPNPTDGVLVIETQSIASLQGQTYRISNMMGQVLLQGLIADERQRIDVAALPQGMYFITVGEGTRKIVVK